MKLCSQTMELPLSTELCDLCVKYGTDKVIWGYTPHYYERLLPIRNSVKKVLEIGICGHRDIPNNVVGASLFVWRDFFPNATIYGIDNDSRWIFNDQDRIRTGLCNAYNEDALNKTLAQMGFDTKNDGFEFICDDAVHDPVPQCSLAHNLWSLLSPGGWYAIEDVCPYKLPDGDMIHFLNLLPKDPYWAGSEIIATHKDERLVLMHKNPL